MPTETDQARTEMRALLHRELDVTLDATTALPDGSDGTVLDDLIVRCMHGLGVAIRLAAVPPHGVEERPRIVSPHEH